MIQGDEFPGFIAGGMAVSRLNGWQFKGKKNLCLILFKKGTKRRQINRFKTPGDFASYCRTVDSRRMSNGKKKGDNNQKCGNKYLAWAFVEAANFAKRYDEHCRKWIDRKAAKTSTVIATKALACKLAKAAWHVMSQSTDYDSKRMFPELATKTKGKS